MDRLGLRKACYMYTIPLWMLESSDVTNSQIFLSVMPPKDLALFFLYILTKIIFSTIKYERTI